MDWFVRNRPELLHSIPSIDEDGNVAQQLLSLPNTAQLKRILRVLLDETEFLSDYGVRSLSRHHLDNPYVFRFGHMENRVDYDPAESSIPMFGGNSNWRGPIWFPVNYLLIESLREFHRFYGDDFKVECPTGSKVFLNLSEVADELSHRLIRIFLRDADGRRPVYRYPGMQRFDADPHWKEFILFFEYFHGDTGAGLGASHQTGWTGLVATLLTQSGE
jgi:hypothetical protein